MIDTNNSINTLMDFVNKMTDTNNFINILMDFGNSKMLKAKKLVSRDSHNLNRVTG